MSNVYTISTCRQSRDRISAWARPELIVKVEKPAIKAISFLETDFCTLGIEYVHRPIWQSFQGGDFEIQLAISPECLFQKFRILAAEVGEIPLLTLFNLFLTILILNGNISQANWAAAATQTFQSEDEQRSHLQGRPIVPW